MRRFDAVFAALLLSLLCLPARLHGASEDFQLGIRQMVQQQELFKALSIGEDQLAEYPDDLEARGWRARLLAWTHRWNESEVEYEAVLQCAPHDMDILVGLADLLIWQKRSAEALTLLDRAATVDASRNDVHLRRGRLLHALGRRAEAGSAYSRVFSFDWRFGGLRDESTVGVNRGATTGGYGNRWSIAIGLLHGDGSLQRNWLSMFHPASASESSGRIYGLFGKTGTQWDTTDSGHTSWECFSGGRNQASTVMNYAIRF